MTAAVAAELPGSTTVSRRAVRRIAARAAREVAGVEPGVTVQADIHGARTTLDVRFAIRYPQPIDRIAEACRAHLIDRTTELTGLEVAGIDIEVAALITETVAVVRVR
ncbi:Asp23/Gls24 family envelope stress response protein [Nocardia sp. NPDC050710]|uniref:Asp23/Gls24 family envelope stress response protein n=1 Tax=Nocardia sp. NPDC050710 TaxID=3157220 RepID=UPI0033D0333A